VQVKAFLFLQWWDYSCNATTVEQLQQLRQDLDALQSRDVPIAGIRAGHHLARDVLDSSRSFRDIAALAAALVFQSAAYAPATVTSGRATGRRQFSLPFDAEDAQARFIASIGVKIVGKPPELLRFEHRMLHRAGPIECGTVEVVEAEASGRKEGPASAAVVAADAAMMADAARRVEVSAAEAADSTERLEERTLAVGRTLRPRGLLGVRDTAGLVAAVHGVTSLLVRDAPAQAVDGLRSSGDALVTNVRPSEASAFRLEDASAVERMRYGFSLSCDR
jgi:hypothetical protein